MGESEAPESLGTVRLGIGYEQSRKKAAKVVFLGVSYSTTTLPDRSIDDLSECCVMCC